MDEAGFLAEAAPFLQWLQGRLDGSGLNHSWVSRSPLTGIQKGTQWACNSLFSAYEGYRWRAKCTDEPGFPNAGMTITNFQDTAQCLEWIGEHLRNAIEQRNAAECHRLCKSVLMWGGVWRRRAVAATLRAQGEELPQYLNCIQAHFAKPDLDCVDVETEINVGGRARPIGLDSGTTKIFSLVCPGFVMYDGRVGAALGYLVRTWNQDAYAGDPQEIPECLRFGWGYRANKYRDPKPNRHPRRIYPLLENKSGARIGHNLRANWLCKSLAQAADNTRFAQLGGWQNRKRPLEAGLFMIGYSVAIP